jgi:ribosomal protein S18 acetylase RimI-like enzyme
MLVVLTIPTEAIAMTLRPATHADLPELRAMYLAAVRALHAAGIDQWSEDYPAGALDEDIERGWLFVAQDEDGIVAAVALNDRADVWHEGLVWTSERAMVVHRLVVASRAQGKGIARRVMLWAHEYAHANGYAWMHLDTNVANRSAMELYHRLGYRDVGRLIPYPNFMAMEYKLEKQE